MELDKKIDLINVYKKLLTHNLPIKTDVEGLKESIQGEFHQWIESRLHELLGGAPKQIAQFSEAEVTAIRALLAMKDIPGVAATFKKLAEKQPQPPVTLQQPPKELAPKAPPKVAPEIQKTQLWQELQAQLNAQETPEFPNNDLYRTE